jgi:hypothetical protein
MIFAHTNGPGRVVPDYVATIPFARGARQTIDWHDGDDRFWHVLGVIRASR